MERTQRIIDNGEIEGREYAIVRNERRSDDPSIEDWTWHCAYVQIREDEFLYRIATSGKKHYLPGRVHGGFSYADWGQPLSEDENTFFVGWDYNHDPSTSHSPSDIRREVKRCVMQFNEATLEDVTRDKLSMEPKWFQEGIERLFE